MNLIFRMPKLRQIKEVKKYIEEKEGMENTFKEVI
jgi:hypothetical protein